MDKRGRVRANPRFDHFDVKGWSYTTWAPGVDPAGADFARDNVTASYVYALHGNQTPDGDVPTSGTGTYTGSMRALDFPTDDGVSSSNQAATRYLGDVTLTASFGSSSVSGGFFNLESQPGDRSSNYAGVQGNLTFDASVIGSKFTASNLTGTQDIAGYQNGSVRGAFFGPAAEEAGGVFDAIDAANNRALVGWFGTEKE